MPPKERGHKQLGRAAALWHLAQLQAFFLLGTATMLAPAVSVWHARLLIAGFGLAYTLEVRSSSPLRESGCFSECFFGAVVASSRSRPCQGMLQVMARGKGRSRML